MAIERIGDKYDGMRDKIFQEKPDMRNFVKCYIYKQGKMLYEFMLNDYEQYIDKVIDGTKIPKKNLLKDNFMHSVSQCGYGVEVEVDQKKFDPRHKEFIEKHAKLEKDFKNELMKLYGIDKHPNKEKIFDYCVKAAKDGGFYFVEDALIDILDLMGIMEKPKVEIPQEPKE